MNIYLEGNLCGLIINRTKLFLTSFTHIAKNKMYSEFVKLTTLYLLLVKQR